jgi:hypothetical protein
VKNTGHEVHHYAVFSTYFEDREGNGKTILRWILERICGLVVDGTGSRSCSMVGFGISDALFYYSLM